MLGAQPVAAVDDAVGRQFPARHESTLAVEGRVHVDDSQGGGVPVLVGQHRSLDGVSFLLLFAGHVDEDRVAVTGDRLVAADVVTAHQRAALRWEQSPLGVDRLQIVLRLDQRVVAAEPLDFSLDVLAIGGHLARHLVGVVGEHPPVAVLGLELPQVGDGGGQERVAGPGRAPEDAGSVGGCDHRYKVARPLVVLHVLRLVALQQQVGGGADDVGGGLGGEEQRAGLAELDHVALPAPPAALVPRVVEAVHQAQDGIDGLRLEGGRGLDDLPALALVEVHQVGFQLA